MSSLAIDMGLPVLAELGAELGVAPGRAALTLTVFLAGFALGPVVLGPLSDRVGRRPVLLGGCAVYAGCGLLAAFAGSFDALLAWRFGMGLGAGACSVLVTAIVRDLFDGAEARVRQSYVSTAAAAAPVLAPTLGAVVAGLGGWRVIYAVLAGVGVLLLAAVALAMPEPLPPARRARGGAGVRGVAAGYRRVLRSRATVGYALTVALGFGCLFAYITGSSLVLVGTFGVSRRAYGALFAVTSLGIMGGAFASARLGRRGVAPGRLVAGGLAAVVLAASALLALTLAGRLGAPALVGLAVVAFAGYGLARPNAVQGALDPVPEAAGAASAVLSTVQTLVGAGASALVAAGFDGRSPRAVTGVMALAAVGAAAAYAGAVRPAVRRAA